MRANFRFQNGPILEYVLVDEAAIRTLLNVIGDELEDADEDPSEAEKIYEDILR
jgi:hypothetical protein